MHLYPAIDIRGGRCVRLEQGDYGLETIYDDDPVAVAKAFAAAGAPWVHVVDLDAARTGEPTNRDLILAVAAAVGDVPVQTGGGVRTADDVAELLGGGVSRVVMGTVAVEDPDRTLEVVRRHPGQVAIGLDRRDGDVAVRGWREGTGRSVLDVFAPYVGEPVGALIVTDIGRDGLLQGPDVEGYRSLVTEVAAVPVIASGGVGDLRDLAALVPTGVSGVIVGKAIYERRFTVEEGVAACAPSA